MDMSEPSPACRCTGMPRENDHDWGIQRQSRCSGSCFHRRENSCQQKRTVFSFVVCLRSHRQDTAAILRYTGVPLNCLLTPRMRRKVQAHGPHAVFSAAFAVDGILATGGGDKTVKVQLHPRCWICSSVLSLHVLLVVFVSVAPCCLTAIHSRWECCRDSLLS